MTCFSPIAIDRRDKIDGLSNRLLVPCGQCLACRINRRSDWSFRMHLESSYWSAVTFLTLTYDDEHLPMMQVVSDDVPIYVPTLVKRDVQLYMKRLRKNLDGRSIKYFFSGEYGEHTFRPHYHAILYGVAHDADYDLLKSSWHKGNIMSLPVKDGSFDYVAGYVVDKVSGLFSDDFYLGRQVPFCLSSQGLGLRVLDTLDCEQVFRDGYIVDCNGRHRPVPRYLLKHIARRIDLSAYDRSVVQYERNKESQDAMKQYWFERGDNEFEMNRHVDESIRANIDILIKKTRQKLKGVL